jgi:hypothetical protein
LVSTSAAVARAVAARPIGRRTSARRRIPRTGPRRPSTTALLSEIRSLLHHELGNVAASLRRIERGARVQLDIQSVTADQLELVLARLVKLERAVGVVEQPKAPRISRHRLLE